MSALIVLSAICGLGVLFFAYFLVRLSRSARNGSARLLLVKLVPGGNTARIISFPKRGMGENQQQAGAS